VGPGLRVLFVGINPSLTSARSGTTSPGPATASWPTLHAAGFTPRRLQAADDAELPRHGVGVTNLVDRPTRAAADLGPRNCERARRRSTRWSASTRLGSSPSWA